LDKKTGILMLDGHNVLDIQDKNIATPTRLICDIHDDVYDVVLYDRYNSVIWEYLDKNKYCIIN